MDMVRDPADFLTGDNRIRAVKDLRRYFKNYTGSWFDRLADHDRPHQITANDIVAVSMLGVDIPASTSIWLLEDGAAEVEALLSRIPAEQTLWDDDADLSPSGPAWHLWQALRAASWSDHHGGMGRTKTSKLMAAKRPHLIPIYDSVVARILWGQDPPEYWAPWRARMSGAGGQRVRTLAEEVQQEAGVGGELSVLRVLDIVIWMSVR